MQTYIYSQCIYTLSCSYSTFTAFQLNEHPPIFYPPIPPLPNLRHLFFSPTFFPLCCYLSSHFLFPDTFLPHHHNYYHHQQQQNLSLLIIPSLLQKTTHHNFLFSFSFFDHHCHTSPCPPTRNVISYVVINFEMGAATIPLSSFFALIKKSVYLLLV